MYWSLLLVALVPPTVVDGDVDGAGVPAGAVAVMLVALLTVNAVAAVPPKLTALAPWRLVPVIVTVVPPAVGPGGRADGRDGRGGDVGVLVVAAGGAGAAGGRHCDVDGAGGSGGGGRGDLVALLTVNAVAAVLPKLTEAPLMKLVPVIVTAVPLLVGPAVGLMLVTVGGAS